MDRGGAGDGDGDGDGDGEHRWGGADCLGDLHAHQDASAAEEPEPLSRDVLVSEETHSGSDSCLSCW